MKHMTINEREIIEDSLKNNLTFTEIGEKINYHRTTVAGEILKHRIKSNPRTYGTTYTYCKYEDTCTLYSGSGCKKSCSKFELKECKITTTPPYVCNGCNKKTTCRMQKYYYRYKQAQNMYEETLKDSRSGLNIPSETIDDINNIIAPLIKEKHQTVNQVYLNHPDILYFSKSEFYRLVNLGYVDIKNIDLPRKVKYRKRSKNAEKRITRKNTKVRIGRTYEDYKKYVKNHPNDNIVEIDTVIGEVGGKVFLTLTFIKYELMLIYLLDNKDVEHVSKKIRWIQNTLGTETYSLVFKCGLTDNGSEFYMPDVYEKIEDQKVCHLFYCDPSSPYQKPCCEVNHHYIRYYLPKKTCTFDDLTQDDCNLIMSHIASIPREKLNGKTPFKATFELLSEEQLNSLGIVEIDKDEVSLSPKILNGRGKRK